MKKIICLMLIKTVVSFAYAQTMPANHEWKVSIKVVDEAGNPIAGAKASVGYFSKSQPASIDGLTETNGVFTASHYAFSGELGFTAEKTGYYMTIEKEYELGFPYNYARWNPNPVLVLKKIGNPIPMYAKRVEVKLQQVGKPMGFDLEAGDWVTPLGKGFHADMFFTVQRKIISRLEYDCTLTVTFPNQGDGIVVAPPVPDTGSEFKTSRTASENGYEPELDLHYSNTNQPPSVFGYFIRVRTELNPDGTVKSALYGKIQGGFRFYAGTIKPTSGMGFTYYLNPTPNDRNLEFNPKKNLVKDLKPLEQVKEP
jgi:hypothetical protein